ncbi:hypothetical protein KBW71_25340 [Hydrogenophaga aromaticivorans]|uniref:hypothetical protein n=1 Tax=Hydrogenophaga aromaticivorans TaxID=2610898 RepID=UPI001B369FEB|nr:hypothetical protein [Hydrogenophaga aromaticivorans]MBQ0921772.1 hypothetical protein [Hydrogenophaga aromaticivorans]
MKIQPNDLILRFDSSTNNVLMLVPKSLSNLDVLKRFFEISLPEDVSVAELADEIGIAVASFLHARHGDRIKLTDSVPDGDALDTSDKSTFEEARLSIDRLGDDSTADDVEAVSVMLKYASDRGEQDATRYLKETWPGLKAVFLRRISRKGS